MIKEKLFILQKLWYVKTNVILQPTWCHNFGHDYNGLDFTQKNNHHAKVDQYVLLSLLYSHNLSFVQIYENSNNNNNNYIKLGLDSK